MVVSTDAEKAFDQIQHLFMIKKKTPQKVGRGIYLNINIIAIYEKPTTSNILYSENLKTFLLRSGIRIPRCPFSSFLFSVVLEVLAMTNREEKEIKGILIEKLEVKLSDEMIINLGKS